MKLFYKIASKIRKVYWYLFRPQTYGVKCLIQYDDKFLLIQNSYEIDLWNIPGGGVHKREDRVNAIHREVFEETGIVLQNAEFLGEYISLLEYKRDTVYCFKALVESRNLKLNGEIRKAEWFMKDDFPKNISYSLRQCLNFLG